MSPRKPDPLSTAQSEEVQRRAPWDKPDALRPWDARIIAHAKRGTKVVAAITAFATALSAAGGVVVKAWRYIRTGGATAPAELPKGTGVKTVATDFVDPPKSP